MYSQARLTAWPVEEPPLTLNDLRPSVNAPNILQSRAGLIISLPPQTRPAATAKDPARPDDGQTSRAPTILLPRLASTSKAREQTSGSPTFTLPYLVLVPVRRGLGSRRRRFFEIMHDCARLHHRRQSSAKHSCSSSMPAAPPISPEPPITVAVAEPSRGH